MGAFVVVVVAFGVVLYVFTDRVTERPPYDHLAAMGAVETGDSFAVQVSFADASSMWLGSTDGGATWTRISQPSEPLRFAASQSNVSLVDCANDGVCYLLHEKQRWVRIPYLVDRLNSDHTWGTDASFGEEDCWMEGIAVDARLSERAIVDCGESTIAYRIARGNWRIVDVVKLAKALR